MSADTRALPSPAPGTEWNDGQIAGRRLRAVAVDDTHVEAHVLHPDGTKARTTRIQRRAWTRRFSPAPRVSEPVGTIEDAERALLAAIERQSVLAAGLAWLYQTAQPDGAIVNHGPSLAAGERTYTFHPTGGQRRGPEVVIDVRHPRYEDRGRRRVLTNPLHPGELVEVADVFAILGVTVVDRWNGTQETGSLRLADPAHPSLLAAHRRYLAQCPRHRTVFCGRPADEGGDGCSWYRAGAELLVPPTHPLCDPPATAVVTVDESVVTAGNARLVTATDTPPATAPADDDEARCRVCGCTENNACPGGCWWVPDPTLQGDLCSACPP